MSRFINDRHFKCTVCGKCCYGWLPLTFSDAFAHANRFPLAMLWIPIPQHSKAFPLTAQLGITLKLRNRKQIAVLIIPTSYLPPSFPCPELTADNYCAIHSQKPLRCMTMPFYSYREEIDQAEQLIPRSGWECDISAAAPLVYHKGRIVERGDFDRERYELLQQVSIVRTYADYMLKYTPLISEYLTTALQKSGGYIVTSLSSLLTAIRKLDAQQIAIQQFAVLNRYIEKTVAIPEYHANYVGWAKEMEYWVNRHPGSYS